VVRRALDVSSEAAFTHRVAAKQDHSRKHRFVLGYHSLNLFQLNAKATNLYLVIATPEKIDIPV
jgi:hypothetical protein